MELSVTLLSDPGPIGAHLRRDESLHAYELADLDPALWPLTRWHGGWRGEQLVSVALLYLGSDPPTLLLLGRASDPDLAALLVALQQQLPTRLHAHLAPGLERHLGGFELSGITPCLKMALLRPGAISDDDAVQALGPDDHVEIEALYARAYPDNHFDPQTLETGAVVGLRIDGALACVAGIHALSRRERVAALGNIATDPAHRGRGLAQRTTGALCHRLLSQVDTIGLNVDAENTTALAVYRRLGFEIVAPYVELDAARWPGPAGA
ncbi:MAG TPA: GNAT family N-acetyltransferase [Deltaproteobacteria bacterium]|nr:GNAT family N-acetyltransferase [Deltaproteobacteria bacterium]